MSVCLSIYLFIGSNFKEPAHVMVGLANLAGRANRLEGQGRADAAFKSKGRLRANALLLGEVSFVPLMLSTDWMEPTHVTEGHLLYSKSTELNVGLI